MLGKEEAKEVDPQEREFLAACLRVRRERGARTLPPTLATPLHTPAKSRLGHRWVPAHTPCWPSASDTIRRRASRPAGHFLATSAISDGQDWSPETLDGKEGLRAAVEKLLMTTAALQAQERETIKKLNKLEQRTRSAVITGVTMMADKVNDELAPVRSRLEVLEQAVARGLPSSAMNSSSAELSPFPVKGDDRAPTPQQDDQTLPQTQSSPHEMASREQEDVTGAAEAALMPKRLVAQTNGLQAWIEEEARKLDRVECELQKQVLENRECLSHLESKVDKLEHVAQDVSSAMQVLKDEVQSLASEMQSELRMVSSLDVEGLRRHFMDLQNNTQDLSNKLERLTVVVGTAAFFHKDLQGWAGGGTAHDDSSARHSHDPVSELGGQALRSSQTQTSPLSEFDKSASQVEDGCRELLRSPPSVLGEDVHEMLKQLSMAVKALQVHSTKAHTGVRNLRDKCKREYDSLQIEVQRQERKINGFVESWSVESAGMTEQVLSIWSFVRTLSDRTPDRHQHQEAGAASSLARTSDRPSITPKFPDGI